MVGGDTGGRVNRIGADWFTTSMAVPLGYARLSCVTPVVVLTLLWLFGSKANDAKVIATD